MSGSLPTLYLLRHGETENNVQRVITGWSDSALTERGRQQAHKNGELLATLVSDWSDVEFIASPLGRTQETMRLVREAAGLSKGDYRTDDRLKEVNFGDWTSLRIDDMFGVRAKHDEYERDPWHFRMPNGESRADVHTRISNFLEELKRDAVIVGHAGSVVMLRGIRLALNPAAIMKLEARNAGIVRVWGNTEAAYGV